MYDLDKTADYVSPFETGVKAGQAAERLIDFVHAERLQLRSPIGDFAVNGSMLKNEGAIKQMIVPPGWIYDKSNVTQISASVLKKFHFQDDDATTISLYYRGNPVSEEQGKMFINLLRAKSAHSDWKLTVDEIKLLSPIMGAVVGDNQYTNSILPGSNASPTFKIESARVRNVDGRAVLQVRGQIVDENGNPTKNYDGIFIPVDDAGRQIQQVTLQCDPKRDFAPLATQFDAAVRTIQLH